MLPRPPPAPSPAHHLDTHYRLWFQLTRTIESFFAVPSSQPFRIDLYEQFIREFGGKLDPLKHAAIAVSVARSYEGERRLLAAAQRLPGMVCYPVMLRAQKPR